MDAVDDFFHGDFSMKEPERFIRTQARFEPKAAQESFGAGAHGGLRGLATESRLKVG